MKTQKEKEMNWDAIIAFSELGGVIAIIASLIYVAVLSIIFRTFLFGVAPVVNHAAE